MRVRTIISARRYSYRLYFGRDGDTLIILLCGGTKRRQDGDITQAKAHWAEYKRRKKEEEG